MRTRIILVEDLYTVPENRKHRRLLSFKRLTIREVPLVRP